MLQEVGGKSLTCTLHHFSIVSKHRSHILGLIEEDIFPKTDLIISPEFYGIARSASGSPTAYHTTIDQNKNQFSKNATDYLEQEKTPVSLVSVKRFDYSDSIYSPKRDKQKVASPRPMSPELQISKELTGTKSPVMFGSKSNKNHTLLENSFSDAIDNFRKYPKDDRSPKGSLYSPVAKKRSEVNFGRYLSKNLSPKNTENTQTILTKRGSLDKAFPAHSMARIAAPRFPSPVLTRFGKDDMRDSIPTQLFPPETVIQKSSSARKHEGTALTQGSHSKMQRSTSGLNSSMKVLRRGLTTEASRASSKPQSKTYSKVNSRQESLSKTEQIKNLTNQADEFHSHLADITSASMLGRRMMQEHLMKTFKGNIPSLF